MKDKEPQWVRAQFALMASSERTRSALFYGRSESENYSVGFADEFQAAISELKPEQVVAVKFTKDHQLVAIQQPVFLRIAFASILPEIEGEPRQAKFKETTALEWTLNFPQKFLVRLGKLRVGERVNLEIVVPDPKLLVGEILSLR